MNFSYIRVTTTCMHNDIEKFHSSLLIFESGYRGGFRLCLIIYDLLSSSSSKYNRCPENYFLRRHLAKVKRINRSRIVGDNEIGGKKFIHNPTPFSRILNHLIGEPRRHDF